MASQPKPGTQLGQKPNPTTVSPKPAGRPPATTVNKPGGAKKVK
jgi:hypothetical protein